ncbi:hypothetical protein TWF694_009707 [Orbilia ellipsospora]|uniref:RNB domain-containing protein n=1 Tax=Orbilia ellipsospora TaxID=2528407 RepID=A0AAV9XBL3_9PEZI
MSLRCPRCTLIAPLRAARLRPPRIPRHNPTPTRFLTTSLPLTRTGKDRSLYVADHLARQQLKQDTLDTVKAKLRNKETITDPDEVRLYVQARSELREQEGIKVGFNLRRPDKSVIQFSDGTQQENLRSTQKSNSPNPNSKFISDHPALKNARKKADKVYPSQISSDTMRERLNEEWRQREADHQKAFNSGANVDLVMDRLIDDYTWQTGHSEDRENTVAQSLDNGRVSEERDLDPESFATRKSDLTAGTLVEMRHSDQSIPYLTVLLKNKTGNYSREAYVLTWQGALQLVKVDMSHFVLPDFIDPTDIDELLSEIQKTGRLDESITQRITQKVRDFKIKAQKLYPGIAARIGRYHNSLADPEKTKLVTTVEIAKAVTEEKEPSDGAVYATHLALLARRDLFSIVEYFEEVKWEVKSLAQIERAKWLELVLRESMSDENSQGAKIVAEFAEKAKKVIDFSRKARKERKSVEEMDEKLDVVWNPREMDLLKCLQENLDYRHGQSGLKSLYPHLLSLVDRYKDHRFLDDQRLFQFLGEVGVHSPWEDSVLREPHLALAGHRTNEQAILDEERYSKIESGELGWKQLGFEDKVKKLRRDWKDMPVYCIDDASTKDIDDGVSIEKIPGSENELWVHVHVANPTAFIPMDHWIGEIARRKVTTFYGAQRNYPMIPLRLSTDYMGLAPNRPAITFSCRMDVKNGKMLEYLIQPSIVRNVKRVTYELLDSLFITQVPKSLVVSNKPVREDGGVFKEDAKLERLAKAEAEPESVTNRDIELLRTLYNLSWEMRGERMRGGAFESGEHDAIDITVDDGRGNKIHPGILERPFLDVHEPTITLTVDQWKKSKDVFSWRDVVRECMTIAGHIGAKWSAERGLMQLYRGHKFIWANEEDEHKWYSVLRKAEDKDGYTPADFWRLFFPVGSGELSTEMKRHTALGMEGYLKVTSPLRRYSDFLTHHIIQKQLLDEAAGRWKRGQEAKQMMTKEEMEKIIKEILEKEKQNNSAERASTRLWAIRLLKALWKRKDPQIPSTVDVQIISVSQWPALLSGEIKELGMSGVRLRCPSNVHKEVKYGDVVKATIMDHWSTDSDNVQMVTMQYVDYVETMEDKMRRFWKSIGQGENWSKEETQEESRSRKKLDSKYKKRPEWVAKELDNMATFRT